MRKLRDTTTALSICSSGRCGSRGIKILGFEFSPDARIIEIKDLAPGVVAKLLHHSELVVDQIAGSSVRRPDPVRPERSTAPADTETPASAPASESEAASGVRRRRRRKPRSDD
jgi:hypothetical protein